MTETRIHPETGKTLIRGLRTMVVQYGSLAREVEVAGWYPADDSDAIHSGADLKAADEAFAELRRRYSDHVRKVRLSLNLTQEEAGEIIGGGKRAFQKYETGKAPPSDAAVGLIEVLSRLPESLEIVRNARHPAGTRPVVKRAGRQRRERAVAC